MGDSGDPKDKMLARSKPMHRGKPMKRGNLARRAPENGRNGSTPNNPSPEQVNASHAQKERRQRRLKAKPDPELRAWSKRIRERDKVCQELGGCKTGDTRLDAHHIAPRGRRPDLRYTDSNGILLCRTRHQWIDTHQEEAIAIGLLSDESYELAMKQRLERNHERHAD